MIIGITGYGCTGASALIDLLMEYENVQAYASSVEFQILQQPDGILDLKHYMVDSKQRLSISTIVSRFINNMNNPRTVAINKATNGMYKIITKKYLSSLIQIRWKGKSAFDPVDLRKKYDTRILRLPNKVIDKILRTINRRYAWPKKEYRYFSIIDEKEFDKKTRKYLCDILKASNFDLKKPIILEQLYNPCNPLAGSEFFDDTVSIIVDRDPRDVYILMNHYFSRGTSFMPDTGNVYQFITYYKRLHSSRIEAPNVLYIQYEDLIYYYNDSIQKISIALNNIKHINEKKHFVPEYSINNTKLYERFPKYRKEIELIEIELKDFLYDFESAEKNMTIKPVKTSPFNRQSDIGKKIKRY